MLYRSVRPWDGVRFPLPDSTAACLVDVLLGDDPREVHRKLVAAFQLDPSLTLWATIQSGLVSADGVLPTLDDLAVTVRHHVRDWLQGDSSVAASTGATPPVTDQWAALAEAAVKTAVRASEHAASPGSAADTRRIHLTAYLCAFYNHLSSPSGVRDGDAAPAPGAAWEGLHDLVRRVRHQSSEWTCAERAWYDEARLPEVERRVRQWWHCPVSIAGHLPAVVGRMARLHELEQQFETAVEEEKLQAMYKLAAGAGHEINNPLGSIAGRAQLLLRDEGDPERRRTLAKINTQAFRAHEMISDMMLYAKPPAPVFARIDVVSLIRNVVEGQQDDAIERGMTLRVDKTCDAILIDADETQLTVALRAMCTNALEALGSDGTVVVSAAGVGPVDERVGAEITVSDNGPGLTDEQRRHLFDPFYSGREAGRGLGFGLSKAWRIVRAHGGRIDVASQPGHGATFTIRLPAAKTALPAAA